jgi:hypothetical protein
LSSTTARTTEQQGKPATASAEESGDHAGRQLGPHFSLLKHVRTGDLKIRLTGIEDHGMVVVIFTTDNSARAISVVSF